MNTWKLNRRSLAELVAEPAGICASVYLATERTGDATKQTPIRLKNALTAFEKRLCDAGMRSTAARAFLAPLQEVIDDAEFSRSHAGEGAALFLSSNGLRAYTLGRAPENRFRLENRFHIRPLLLQDDLDGEYLMLAVSANATTLYAGTRAGLVPLKVEALPHGLAETLSLDQPTPLVQAMTNPAGSIFFGQGGEIDRRKGELRDYFRAIDRALQPILREESRPLIFAGVQYLFPLYRQVNSYPHLVETPLTGNPDRVGEEALHLRAEELLLPVRRHETELDVERFERAVGEGKTSVAPSEVLAAAHAGAVEALFFDRDAVAWGRYDERSGGVDMTNEDDPIGTDLLDLAVHRTLLNGGRVHGVKAAEVPGGGIVAALLRYVWRPRNTGLSSEPVVTA